MNFLNLINSINEILWLTIIVSLDYNNTLKSIMELQGSVNLYMFHGGTNFGFMNGANSQAGFPFYLPDVTSYGKMWSKNMYHCELLLKRALWL